MNPYFAGNRPILTSNVVTKAAMQGAMRRVMGLAGLADLGDSMTAPAAATDLASVLASISAKAGAAWSTPSRQNMSLVSQLSFVANTFNLGYAGNLPDAAQAAWNAWTASASGTFSPDYPLYILGRWVGLNSSDLLTVAANEAASAPTDVYYSLFQGTQVSNEQWGTLASSAISAMIKGIRGGVLSMAYLDVVVKGLVTSDPATRRMPHFIAPPGNLTTTDPQAIAFRTMLKQLGWNDVVSTWQGFTSQAWAAENAAFESSDQSYGGPITALSYISGEKVLEQVQAKVAEYFDIRSKTAQSIADFDGMVNGSMGSLVPEADKAAMNAIKAQFQATDGKAMNTLAPVGMWPQGLGDLGGVQLILAGVLAVTVLGLLAYVVATMTETSRIAAAQTKATADSMLANVNSLRANAQAVYDASAKTPEDTARYQAALATAQQWANDVPKPPESILKNLAWVLGIGAVAIVGVVIVRAKFGKK